MPEQINSEIKKYSSSIKVKENPFIVTMIDIGLLFYSTLPHSMRPKLFDRNQKLAARQKMKAKLEERARNLVLNLKMNEIVAFRISKDRKKILIKQALKEHMSLSEFLRTKFSELIVT